MQFRLRLEILAFVCAIFASRLVCRSHVLYDIDSVNFALGILHFNPATYQPHPPGYILYILAGRLFNVVSGDANLALVLLSIASSCGSVVLLYKLARTWFGLADARFACLIFLFSPLAWFHGTVALTYSVEAFFSLLLAFLCWHLVDGTSSRGWPAGLALGIAAGVRPSSLLLLGPIFVFSLIKTPRPVRLRAIASLLVTSLAWALPMVTLAGGLRSYLNALLSLWSLVPSQQTVFNSSPATSIARAATVAFILLLLCGTATLALFVRSRSPTPEQRLVRFTVVWTVPALLFFTFVYLKFVTSGYLLLLAGPCCLWLGHWTAGWYSSNSWRPPAKLGLLTSCALVNTWIYLASPFYCSFRSVRQFEHELAAIQAELVTVCSPSDTLIVGFDSHFLGYRHAGYYFPQFLTLQYPEVKLPQGFRVFALDARDTLLLSRIPASDPAQSAGGSGSQSPDAYRRFVLFPLPAGDSGYDSYVKSVAAKLPSGSLTETTVGSHTYRSGRMQDLALLFPHAGAALASSGCVSSPSLSAPGCKQP